MPRRRFTYAFAHSCNTPRRYGAVNYRHERRTRALARLTSDERRQFVTAIRAYPGAAQETAREARETFAAALRLARARDDAMMAGGRDD